MPHPHGPHECYCPYCQNRITADESLKCNLVKCPVCGSPMRAVQTGERRASAKVSGASAIAGHVAEPTVAIDDQPIRATFFDEARWLTDFITPDSLEVQDLHKQLTEGLTNTRDRIIACWKWVTSQVKYVRFVKGKLWINGKASVQTDLWTLPETTINTRVGNCAVKSFLLTSLLRNELPAEQVFCALGNLYNGSAGGHAWVKLVLDDGDFVMESTMPTAPPLVPESTAARYEPVHYFNDESVYAIEGKTQLVPFTACYSEWLSTYLHWAYIESKRK